MKTSLSFRDGHLSLETPWSKPALGRILVNDEPARGPWSGNPKSGFSSRCGNWRLTVRQTAEGAVQLELTNAGATPQWLRTVKFAEWCPGAFARPLNTADFRELVNGGSFLGMSSGVKCVGRKTPCLGFAPKSSMLTVYQHETGGALQCFCRIGRQAGQP